MCDVESKRARSGVGRGPLVLVRIRRRARPPPVIGSGLPLTNSLIGPAVVAPPYRVAS